jgi:hypothetical protein
VPGAIVALVDAELGFLHNFASLEGGVAVETISLQDLHLEATIDDAIFRPNPARGSGAGPHLGPTASSDGPAGPPGSPDACVTGRAADR